MKKLSLSVSSPMPLFTQLISDRAGRSLWEIDCLAGPSFCCLPGSLLFQRPFYPDPECGRITYLSQWNSSNQDASRSLEKHLHISTSSNKPLFCLKDKPLFCLKDKPRFVSQRMDEHTKHPIQGHPRPASPSPAASWPQTHERAQPSLASPTPISRIA